MRARSRWMVLSVVAGLAGVGCERDRSPAPTQPEASRPRVVAESAPAACAGHEAETSFLEGDRWRLSCRNGRPVFESEGADDAAPTRTALTEAQWDAAWERVEQSGWRGLYDCPDFDQCDAHSEPMPTGRYSIAVTVPDGQRRFACEMSCGELSPPHAAVIDAIRFAAPGQPTPFADSGTVTAAAPGAPGTAKRCGEDWGVYLEVSGKHGAWSAMVRCASGGRALRWDQWDQTPDTHEATGPTRVSNAAWTSLWTGIEAADWRSTLDCVSDGKPGYDGWSLVIRDGAGQRTFRGHGSRFDQQGACGALLRAVDANITSPNNRW